MWLFTSDGFVSIVQPESFKKRDLLLVRARAPGHIESVITNWEVTKSPQRDYMYRATVPRDVVAKNVVRHIYRLDYGNFKDSVRDRNYRSACAQVWTAMFSFQEGDMLDLEFGSSKD